MPGATPLLVLLPGLDGSGDLFAPLCALINGTAPALRGGASLAAPAFEVRVLRYDHAPDQSYARLAQALERELPADRHFVLVAESFGGPLAIRLAAAAPRGVDAVVLVNSFVRSPVTLAQRVMLSALSRVLAQPPAWAVRRFMLGDDAPRALVEAASAALQSTPSSVLAARLRTLVSCDESESYLRCMAPMFYLRATRDRLLGPAALELVAYLRPGLVIESIDAPHLLLQRAPAAALTVLSKWLLRDKELA